MEKTNQIEIKNLTKTYFNGKNAFTALENASLTVEKGEQIAIIGKSGSGKSTLMHVMSVLDSPTSGSIKINGENLSDISSSAKDKIRNQTFGFIFQQFFLNPNNTVLDNITLPLKIQGVSKKEREGRGRRLLREVELSKKEKEKAVNLSGGQKQRVAIARAIINEPEVIFADEPTGNLDTETGKTIIKLLFKYSKEKKVTLIVVTHDEDLSKLCKRQITIVDGKITKDK